MSVRGPDLVCLAPGTPIATPAGQTLIEALQIGDEVLAADPITGAPRVEHVLSRPENHTDWFVELTIGDCRLLATST